ncbi:MAG TPA: hypothetical protein VK517_16210 [Cyclobacteriaceae bacterium]|nr:hypothetical protein [Cyclobacteriaceae bacterium]
MQYIVKEIHTDPSVGTGEVMVFSTLFAALKHIEKIDNNGRFVFGEKEGNLNMVRSVLLERLATVSFIPEVEAEKRWTITAF